MKRIFLGLILASALIPSGAIAQQSNCENYWTNPNTGKTECFGASTPSSAPVKTPQPNRVQSEQFIEFTTENDPIRVLLDRSTLKREDFGSRTYTLVNLAANGAKSVMGYKAYCSQFRVQPKFSLTWNQYEVLVDQKVFKYSIRPVEGGIDGQIFKYVCSQQI